jgi:hypothetical protein
VTTQPLVALKTAVVTSLTSLLTNCQITYGMPTDTYSDDQVIVGDAQVQVSYPTFNRQEHDIDLDITFSSWRAGDATQQQTATEAAMTNYEALVAYLRSTLDQPVRPRYGPPGGPENALHQLLAGGDARRR